MLTDLDTAYISDTIFPSRVLTAFKRANIVSLGELDRMADDELTGLHGIGATTVAMIRHTLTKLQQAGRSRSALA